MSGTKYKNVEIYILFGKKC